MINHACFITKNIEENKETNKNPPITIFGEYGNNKQKMIGKQVKKSFCSCTEFWSLKK
jgi:hypothetical protein